MGRASVFGPANTPVVDNAARRGESRLYRQDHEIVFSFGGDVTEVSPSASGWWPHGQIKIFQIEVGCPGPENAVNLNIKLQDQTFATRLDLDLTIDQIEVQTFAADISLVAGGLRTVVEVISPPDEPLINLVIVYRYVRAPVSASSP